MKRFVTYIYEYDRGARGRNVGFVRTDIRNDGCRMDLHIRGLNCPKAKATIYFVIANAPVIGIPVAEMIISQGSGQAKLMCPQGNIGSSGYHTDQIDAIVIRYHSGQILVSSFVPEPGEEVVRGDFRMWDEFERLLYRRIIRQPRRMKTLPLHPHNRIRLQMFKGILLFLYQNLPKIPLL